MGMIDWNMPSVGFAGGLSRLGDLVDALAERRARQQEAEANRQLQRDQYAANERHWQSQTDMQRRRMDMEAAAAEREETARANERNATRDATARKALPKVTDMLAQGNEDAARAEWLGAGGQALNRVQPNIPEPQRRREQVFDGQDALFHQVADMQEAGDEYAQAQAAREAALREIGERQPYSFLLPSGAGLDQDIGPIRKAREQRIAGAAKGLGGERGTFDAMLSTGAGERDALEAALAEREKNKDRSAANYRAGVAARAAQQRAATTAEKPTEGQVKNAFLGTEMAQDLKTVDQLPPLSPAALEQMQRNDLGFAAADKAAMSGATGNLMVAGARALNLVPKSRYEGLSETEQRAANAWDSALDKYVRLLTGAGMSNEEATRSALQYKPMPGETPELQKQKFSRLRAASQALQTLGGPATRQLKGAGGNPVDSVVDEEY